MKILHKIKLFFVSLFHLFLAAGKGFIEDKVAKLSAALAYYTIFSLTPLIIILLSAATLFVGDKLQTRDKFYIQVTELVGHDAAMQIENFVENANK